MDAWLANGITATVSGMLTVFLVLIIIAFVISKFKYFNNKNKVTGEDSRALSVADIALPKKRESDVDDEEVVAVITAVLAMMQAESKDKLRVRRIRRID